MTPQDTNRKNRNAPSYFKVSEQGVYYEQPDAESLRICSPLEVKALVQDQASENWGRLLVFRDADNQEHT